MDKPEDEMIKLQEEMAEKVVKSDTFHFKS
jgi:hypothetical protein